MIFTNRYGEEGGKRIFFAYLSFVLPIFYLTHKSLVVQLVAMGVLIVVFFFYKLYKDSWFGIKWLLYIAIYMTLSYIAGLGEAFRFPTGIMSAIAMLTQIYPLMEEYQPEMKKYEKREKAVFKDGFKDDSPR